MKINSLTTISLISIGMIACTSGSEQSDTGDTIVATTPTEVESKSMCYIRTEGTGNQDTTSVELVIKDEKVSGQMYWHPFEKDSRRGTLSGNLKGDTVYAVWSFTQEGMQDTLGVEFLIQGDNLMQKPLVFNKATGRQQTDNMAGFTVNYRPSVSLKK